MAEVFSGFVVGYAYSLLFSGIVASMVVEARSRVPYLTKGIAPNIGAVHLAVPISLLAFLVWTMVGLLLGLTYRAARLNLAGGGLGSPNWPFTLAILVATVAFVAVVLYAWQRLPWRVLLVALAFAGMFGWGMPHLAEQGL